MGIVNYSKTFNLNKSATFGSGKDKDDLLPLTARDFVCFTASRWTMAMAPGGEDGRLVTKLSLPVACRGNHYLNVTQ
jgi:hypothetical protein